MILTLQSKKEEVPGVISFIFRPERPISWAAGQFMQYILPHPNPDERGIKRYFTIATAPYEENLMVTTRIAPEKSSSFKKALLAMKTGQIIEATGPHGSFTLQDPSKQYVFVAGGIGITPFRAILLDLAHKKESINVTLLYANRDENIVFKDELEKLVKVHYFIGDNKINSEFITLNSKFYISGPEPFVLSMEKLLSNLGVLDENIKRDYFPGYDRI